MEETILIRLKTDQVTSLNPGRGDMRHTPTVCVYVGGWVIDSEVEGNTKKWWSKKSLTQSLKRKTTKTWTIKKKKVFHKVLCKNKMRIKSALNRTWWGREEVSSQYDREGTEHSRMPALPSSIYKPQGGGSGVRWHKEAGCCQNCHLIGDCIDFLAYTTTN